MKGQFRFDLAPVDVAMLAGSAAGAVWLVCTHLTTIRTSAAVLLAVLAALGVLRALSRSLP